MTNSEIVERFEQGIPHGDDFNHANHVRVGFAYVCEFSIIEALKKFSFALKSLAIKNGRADRYNETITWAYLFLIRQRIARAGGKLEWEEFVEQNSDVLAWEPNILSRYYREETLQSDLAKSMFLMPDLHA